ncbi:DUF356 domain-containing protein [Methanolapillus millepedarum]|uniref:DUF356 domain-containing protein n=1 Tax=Methanolapillus millepedarum TaxID=3028296 RepID=A0AA96V3A1_9EURY|nr:hypothetical protein MsAc7_13400 [Methanosarcinaceae archaeon Ac7]
MKSFALIRADDPDKVKIALHDLETYGHMQFSDNPKNIATKYADQILMNVMSVTLKNECCSASLVQLDTPPGAAISNLKKIHPPAHIIIISPRHEKVYEELMNNYNNFPDFDRKFTNAIKPKKEDT